MKRIRLAAVVFSGVLGLSLIALGAPHLFRPCVVLGIAGLLCTLSAQWGSTALLAGGIGLLASEQVVAMLRWGYPVWKLAGSVAILFALSELSFYGVAIARGGAIHSLDPDRGRRREFALALIFGTGLAALSASAKNLFVGVPGLLARVVGAFLALGLVALVALRSRPTRTSRSTGARGGSIRPGR
jgi:hypothetical protein